jgi:DNA-binding MarR family transcriptional regulator/GNAT superfamily N-acetyltransferase
MKRLSPRPDPAAALRAFDRFWSRLPLTRVEGLPADPGRPGGPVTPAEARILLELGLGTASTLTGLGGALGLDAGYLSRILSGLRARGLVHGRPSESDRRVRILTLTPPGEAAFRVLEAASRARAEDRVGHLGSRHARRLVRALGTVEGLLSDPDPPDSAPPPFRLRHPGPGELGWIVHRHGILYAREYGWGAPFEGLVARVVGDFVRAHDPARERVWVADRGGVPAGSVMLVAHPDRPGVARLRLLLVEPWARGLGIGRALVRACTDFGRARGYRAITLWTNSRLDAARGLYAEAGYRCLEFAPDPLFGAGETAETWELDLGGNAPRSVSE